MTTSSTNSWTVKQRFPRIISWTLLTWRSSRPGVFTDWCSILFEMLKLVALHTTHAFLPVSLLQQLKCFHKIFPKFEAEFHTHTLFFKLLHSWICRTCDASAHFWGCSQKLPLRNSNSHISLYQVRNKKEYDVWLKEARPRRVSNHSKALLPGWYDGTPPVIWVVLITLSAW